MTGLTFDDGAAFVGGGLWLPPRLDFPTPAIIRSRLLVFADGTSRRRRSRHSFVEGLAAGGCGRDAWVSTLHARVNPAHVARAVLYEAEGQMGFLLERPDGSAMAWVPVRAWLEAVRRWDS